MSLGPRPNNNGARFESRVSELTVNQLAKPTRNLQLIGAGMVSLRRSARRFGYQEYPLPYRKRSLPHNRPVDACGVLVHSHHRFHHGRILLRGVGVEVDHHTSLVTKRDAHRRAIAAVAEDQSPPDPWILVEGFPNVRFNDHIRPEPPPVYWPVKLALDAEHRRDADDRHTCLIEYPLVEFHQFHGAPESTREFLTQRIAVQLQAHAFRRTHVRWQCGPSARVDNLRLIEEHCWKSARREPR